MSKAAADSVNMTMDNLVDGERSIWVHALETVQREIQEGQQTIEEHHQKLVEMQKTHLERFAVLEESLKQMQQLFKDQVHALRGQNQLLELQNQRLHELLEDRNPFQTPKHCNMPIQRPKSPRKRAIDTQVPRKYLTKRTKNHPLLNCASNHEATELATTWDQEKCGRFGVVSENGRAITTTGYGWNVVLTEGMVDAFDVQLHFPKSKYNNTIAIGFTCEPEFWREPTPDMQTFDFWQSGWYMNVRRGTLCSRDGHDNSPFASSFKTGDILTVQFNRSLKTIQFLRNGHDLGIAYTDIHEAHLHPALVSYDRGVKLRLMPL